MTLGERIKSLRLQQNMSQEELGLKIGVQKSAVHKYEAGLVVNLKRSVIDALASALNTTPTYLMGWEDENDAFDITSIPGFLPIGRQSLPVLGSVSCGEPSFAEENFEFYVQNGTGIKADFILRASGDSMIGARIYDGDLVFIRQQPNVEDGQIAVVLIDDEALLKRVYKLPDGRCQLRAENPKYPPIMVGGEDETRDVRILGVAVAIQTDAV